MEYLMIPFDREMNSMYRWLVESLNKKREKSLFDRNEEYFTLIFGSSI
jgi:hypothetical protein